MVLKPIGLPQDEQAQNRVVYAAYWGARDESAPRIAERLRDALSAVSMLGGLYSGRGTLATDAEHATLPIDLAGWVDFVMSGYEPGRDGSPYVPGGSSLLLVTDTADLADISIKISVTAGRSEPATARSANHVVVSATSLLADDFSEVASASTPAAARDLVHDLVAIWAPDVATVTTDAAVDAQFRWEWRWMPYVGAITWFSSRVWPIPPGLPDVQIDPLGEGDLVTVGYDRAPSFDTDDIVDTARHLTEQGLRNPAPAAQDREPLVPAVRDLIGR